MTLLPPILPRRNAVITTPGDKQEIESADIPPEFGPFVESLE